MRAGFEYFKNFEQDAKDFAALSTTKLNMPFLVLTGEKASGTFLIDQAKLVPTNVSGTVVQGSGHWLMEEAPDQVGCLALGPVIRKESITAVETGRSKTRVARRKLGSSSVHVCILPRNQNTTNKRRRIMIA